MSGKRETESKVSTGPGDLSLWVIVDKDEQAWCKKRAGCKPALIQKLPDCISTVLSPS